MLMLGSFPAFAVSPELLRSCAAIEDDGSRLSCYDGLAGLNADTPAARHERQQPGPTLIPDATAIAEEGRKASILSSHWELEPYDQRGAFTFRPHRRNYLIATYNPSPNEAPYQPFRALVPGAGDLSEFELAFQIGFKLKLVENIANYPADLWFGYTQNSHWQIANREASSPFRETNYQPELMAVWPLDFDLAGLRLRFLNAGIVHQSNGQAASLSRSWDRLYLQAGLERDNFTLLGRVWKRFDQWASEDDNPDIIDYMGHGDVLATYHMDKHELSLLARANFDTGKGAAQLNWAFPLVPKLNGYVQYFAGYGYTLVDYNVFQRVLGLGMEVDF